MTISSSLNAGVMGLQANASRLGAISDNIANSSTYGYKRSEADFHSMVAGSGGGSYAAGGVRVTTDRFISQGGSLITTNNATDVAVRGRGMIPVTTEAAVKGGGNVPMMLATTGSFRPDADGYLSSASGLVLMGWPANPDGTIPANSRDTAAGLEPIRVNMNQLAGEPTTEVTLGVNLPATATEAGAAGHSESMQVEYFDNLGKSEALNIEFVPTVPGTGTSNEWAVTITDSASGSTIGEYTLTFSDSRADGGSLMSVATITGGSYLPASGTVTVNVAGGPIEINVGQIGAGSAMTQIGQDFAPLNVDKNGSRVSSVVDVEIDANGYVNAIYDSGTTRTMYQVPLADVPNPNGLKAQDNQTYQVSNDSGAFFLWDAGTGPTGEVVGYAREESSTDVASELTELIQTQRAYASSAKVIQTVDEMLQETTNIKR